MFTIDAWNIDRNIVWFVKISDTGSNFLIELFTTMSDAQNGTNRQAYEYTLGFGSSLKVNLTNEGSAVYPVGYYMESEDWHLKVSGQDGDTTAIFRIKEFVELDSIEHAIYRNADLIPLRPPPRSTITRTHPTTARLIWDRTYPPWSQV